MRPIRLEIEGFTSFRQRVDIDFSTFDLFAITGPTGAGKTSIIDALTYVLYGCTARLGAKSGRDLISQGAQRMRVLLEFSSGRSLYRVARETKATGKNIVTNIRFEERNGDDWVSRSDRVSEAQTLIENIVGFDFSGFTKSVVLPQGQFDEFLKGKPDERRKLLSELLQLDVYSRMMKRGNEIAREHKTHCEHLDAQLARDYADATPDNRGRLTTELQELQRNLDKLTSGLDLLTARLHSALHLRAQYADLARAESGLSGLIPERAAAKERLDKITKQIAEAEEQIQSLDKKVRLNRYDADVHLRLSAIFEKSEQLSSLETQVRNREEIQESKKKALLKAETELKGAADRESIAGRQREKSHDDLQSKKALLDSAISKHGSVDAIQSLIEINKRRMKDEQTKMRIGKEIDALEVRRQSRMKELEAIDEQRSEAANKVNQARAELALLRSLHTAQELRLKLKKDETCPVCEQLITKIPKAKKHPSLDEAERLVEQNEGAHTALLQRRSAIEGELGQLEPQIGDKREQLAEVEETIAEAGHRIRSVTGRESDAGTDTELKKLQEGLRRRESDVNEAAKRFDSLREAEAAASRTVKEHERQVSVLKTEAALQGREIAEMQSSCARLNSELGKHSNLEVVKAELKQQADAKQQRDELLRLKERTIESLSGWKDERTAAAGVFESTESRVAELTKSRNRLQKSIQSLAESVAAGFSEVDVSITTSDNDAAAQLERMSQELQSRRDAAQKDVANHEGQLRIVEEKIKRAAEIQTELERHRQRFGLAHELAMALRGDQFIAYVQQEAYHRLAQDGSVHLESLSSGRYSFGVDKDEFVAVDHWNADEPRPVTTLSGGESFLASLALALALAEGLSGLSHGRGRYALESLFLDEGFGTLDAETLDVVLQAVENLSTGERLVGIVSHIPELADRLPSRINVKKSVGGSTIEFS